MSSDDKKGEVGYTPTYKLALIKLFETEKKSFSKEIMSNLQIEKNDRVGEFWRGVICVCSLRKWRVTRELHVHMKIDKEKL